MQKLILATTLTQKLIWLTYGWSYLVSLFLRYVNHYKTPDKANSRSRYSCR